MRQLVMEEPNGEVGRDIGAAAELCSRAGVTRGPCPTPHSPWIHTLPGVGVPVLCSLSHLFLGWPLHPSGLYPPPRPAWLEPTLMEARSHRSTDI